MSSPIRIQLSRAKGWRMPPNTVKVDRSTKWGNPFPVIRGTSTHMGQTKTIWQVGTWDGPAIWFRDGAIEALELSVQAYRAWVTRPSNAPLMTEAKNSLHGKNLACWCKPGSPCHADVLLELANATPAAQREG